MLENLKKEVVEANKELVRCGLITLTWGNASGIDRAEGLMVIKPSGVDYHEMSANDMVVVDLDGKIVEGTFRPSSDTPTHLRLYKSFLSIGGIVHTHSMYATMFAQAHREIPCFGTTHADHFHGSIPVTRILTKKEVAEDYEGNTGVVIVERFKNVDPVAMPGVLVGGHAPFAWGHDAMDAVKNSLILERVAQMAMGSLQLNQTLAALPAYIQEKHYQRKHGPNAYYGQKK
ncbi:MAG TPA: L-ribulose-5-phosphate 4-epimerase [Bacteroidota bacterium]|nr:L-ribulose-5-phosphate 4-epimerase [Bacteroidota bacterium]